MTQEQILLSVLTALESAHVYSALLPSIFTIGTFVTDERGVKLIREGELTATVAAFALGGIVAKFVNNPLPFYFTLVAIAGMLWTYERALAGAAMPS
jgi:hypothetical protein